MKFYVLKIGGFVLFVFFGVWMEVKDSSQSEIRNLWTSKEVIPCKDYGLCVLTIEVLSIFRLYTFPYYLILYVFKSQEPVKMF